jgi:hypothetical protein
MLDANYFSSPSMVPLDMSGDQELQRRLELFQVFSKLYAHHRGLLDEILALDPAGGEPMNRMGLFHYIQGIVSERGAYLVTNLLDGRSNALMQPQHIWTLGRDPRRASVNIRDKRLSRCHAAIQYVKRQGFLLVDLDSTNGSFVNGDRVNGHYMLKDGDLVRLGSLTFTFFVCPQFRTVADPSDEALAGIDKALAPPTLPVEALEDTAPRTPGHNQGGVSEETIHFYRANFSNNN